jgi:ABC-2 type transport system ATP-binding protein
MIPAISVAGLGRRYRGQAALEDVSLTVEPGTVTGLLGRNGAGNTTLMRIITSLEFPTDGEVKVFGAAPAENDTVLRRMVFVREEQAYPDFRVGHAIRVASWFYPNWDAELADRLLAEFDLPAGRADQAAVPRDALGRRDRDRAGGPRGTDAVRRALCRPGRGGASVVL